MNVNDVKGAVYNALKEYKIMQIFDAWERHQNEWKLVYSIYGLTGSHGFLIHTRLIFLFDDSRKELKEKAYLVLADLDCNYKAAMIGTNLGVSLTSNINLLTKSKGQIKDLSDFLMNGTDEFNEILKKENIDQSILDLKYEVQDEKCSCINQSFLFSLSDRTTVWPFSIERQEELNSWHITINNTSFSVDTLKDGYKEIIDSIYGTNGNNV